MTFSLEQVAALSADLARLNVRERKQAGRMLSYIEGWWAEVEANRIFGHHAWNSETVELRLVSEKDRKIGDAGVPGHAVSYIAKVRVTVTTPDGHLVIREGIGAGHGIDRDLGQAHEGAAKEAETDAEKRALKTFGFPFGLALYDKTQAHVSDSLDRLAENAPDRNAPKPSISEPQGRKSSAQAKRDKDDETIKAEIEKLGVVELGLWMSTFEERTAHLPLSWLDSIRDYAEGHLEELAPRPQEAREMDDAYKGTVG